MYPLGDERMERAMEQQAEVSTLLEQGEALLKEGRTREAAATFARAVQIDPNAVGGHLGIAEASFALGDFAVATQASQHVQQLAPAMADGAIARAILAVLAGNYPAALTELDQAVALDPGRAYVHAFRAFCLRQLGQRYDAALAEARVGRIWGTRELDHLFPKLPAPPPPAAPDLPPVPGLAPYSGPRPWQDRPAAQAQAQRRAVQFRFMTRGMPIATYTLMAINVAVYVVAILLGGSLNNPAGNIFVERSTGTFAGATNPLYNFGLMQGLLIQHDPVQAYRIVTSMFLHASILHIGLNMFSLYFVGAVTEQIFGSGRFTIIYFAAGIVGGLAQAVLGPDAVALGASGAIFGIFGAFGAFILLRRRALGPAANGIIGQWFFFLLINIFFSFQPGIGGLDHFGGLATGLLLGALFTGSVGRRRA
jgi:membrane associated rhomboid family serine protease